MKALGPFRQLMRNGEFLYVLKANPPALLCCDSNDWRFVPNEIPLPLNTVFKIYENGETYLFVGCNEEKQYQLFLTSKDALKLSLEHGETPKWKFSQTFKDYPMLAIRDNEFFICLPDTAIANSTNFCSVTISDEGLDIAKEPICSLDIPYKEINDFAFQDNILLALKGSIGPLSLLCIDTLDGSKKEVTFEAQQCFGTSFGPQIARATASRVHILYSSSLHVTSLANERRCLIATAVITANFNQNSIDAPFELDGDIRKSYS